MFPGPCRDFVLQPDAGHVQFSIGRGECGLRRNPMRVPIVPRVTEQKNGKLHKAHQLARSMYEVVVLVTCHGPMILTSAPMWQRHCR